MQLIIYLLLGYLLGSIPFALVIGKVFHNIDVRNYGSGNLGGSNTGRVLGKKSGLAVMICDLLKVVVAVGIVSIFDQTAGIWAGLAAAIGHCYPVFAKFKGGKAVATMFGFLVSTAMFTFKDPWFVIIPFICFLIVLYLSKIVSLSSMIAAIVSSTYISFMQNHWQITLASWMLTILVIYRHRSNIRKIITRTESKISWM